MPQPLETSLPRPLKRKYVQTIEKDVHRSPAENAANEPRQVLPLPHHEPKRRKLPLATQYRDENLAEAVSVLQLGATSRSHADSVPTTICSICKLDFLACSQLVQHCADAHVHNPQARQSPEKASTTRGERLGRQTRHESRRKAVAGRRQKEAPVEHRSSSVLRSSANNCSSEKFCNVDTSIRESSEDLESTNSGSSSEKESDQEELRLSIEEQSMYNVQETDFSAHALASSLEAGTSNTKLLRYSNLMSFVQQQDECVHASHAILDEIQRPLRVRPLQPLPLAILLQLQRPCVLKIMLRMGYVAGQGLGISKQGQILPVSESIYMLPKRSGLGLGSECDNEYGNEGKIECDISEPEVPLCKEQKELCNLVLAGHNVFFTGSAGCGKSTALNHFVRRLKQQRVRKARGEEPHQYHEQRPKQVDILAPTGRAALAVGGRTIFNYMNWSPGSFKKPLKALKAIAQGEELVCERLCNTDVLVIDEISMVENHLYQRLNDVMKYIRGNDEAFGGVQVIITGDFFQLPPVKPFKYCYPCGKENLINAARNFFECPDECSEWKMTQQWAFLSSAWHDCSFRYVQLIQLHRQKDPVFIRLLQKCRVGIPLSREDRHLLLNHETSVRNPVRLFSTNSEADETNQERIDALASRSIKYRCYDNFQFRSLNEPDVWKKRFRGQDDTLDELKDHAFEKRTELKKGMLVVLLSNIDVDNGLVNGSQGIILDFEPAQTGSKGSPRKATGPGARPHEKRAIIPHQTGEYAYEKTQNINAFLDQAVDHLWPVVYFQNGRKRTIYAECRISELGNETPYTTISRTQIPLIPGYAMTIHKSQGMTLESVIVDLSRTFAEGQMYVALSRATNLKGLKVEALGRDIDCNEQVIKFWREHFGRLSTFNESPPGS